MRSERNKQAVDVRDELHEVSLAEKSAISGGAGAFLRGDLAAETGMATLGGAAVRGGGGSFAAQSLTTLECWHECTYQISSC